MASALARGIGEPVLVHDVDARRGRARSPRSSAARRSASNAELAERADVVVLCHKPAQLEEVAGQVGGPGQGASSRSSAATPASRIEAAYPGRAGLPLHPEHPRRGAAGVLCYAPGALARGPRGRAPRAVRPRRGRDAARRGADRAGDGAHELRPRLHGARGRGASSTPACAHGLDAGRRRARMVVETMAGTAAVLSARRLRHRGPARARHLARRLDGARPAALEPAGLRDAFDAAVDAGGGGARDDRCSPRSPATTSPTTSTRSSSSTWS